MVGLERSVQSQPTNPLTITISLGTIISMHETPPLTIEGMPPSDEQSMAILRRNLINVFRQLSKADDPERVTNPMMTLPLRSGSQTLNGGDISNSDVPCLLFYYLFDDWLTSYSLVAREEHQYRAQLEKLVNWLDTVAKELAN